MENVYSGNLGRLFYREYFDDLSKKDGEVQLAKAKTCNTKIHNAELNNFPTQHLAIPNAITCDGKIIYPGLFSGSGISHETGSKDEAKIGFYFDHTTGLPCLPGSSVKGVLRHWFKTTIGNIKNFESESAQNKKEVEVWFANISGLSLNFSEIKDFLEKAQDIIFGNDTDNESTSKMSLYQRDIFFDAYPVKVISKGKDISKFLDSDFITPHVSPTATNRKEAELKEPIPLQFLKLRPEVVLRFQFRLSDTTVKNHTLTVKNKLKLFQYILCENGIGAKTNVGYGRMEPLPLS